MFFFHLLFGACHASLMVAPTTTVVSLFAQGAVPASMEAGPWSGPLRIGEKDFVCKSNGASSSRQFKAFKARAKFAPLAGHCAHAAGVEVCPNSHAVVGSETLSLSEFSSHEGNVQVFENSQKTVALQCAPPEPARPKPRVCRMGDAADAHSVITQTFPDGTAEVRNTRTGVVRKQSLSKLAGGCDSDGTLRLEDFFRLSPHIFDPARVNLHSPICGKEGDIASTLGGALTGSCLITDLHNRQLEFCFPNTLRFVEPRERVGHKWPTAIVATGDFDGEYEIRGKTAVSSWVATGQACAPLQPALTEGYLVEVDGTEIRLEAVGGAFMPMSYQREIGERGEVSKGARRRERRKRSREGRNKQVSPQMSEEPIFLDSQNSVRGVLVFDPNNPLGCSDKSFPAHLLPSAGPWIALTDRNGCMFQEKGLVAQKRGAVGVVVVNTVKRGMIHALAGIQDKPVLDIPVVLVDLEGEILKEHLGEWVSIFSEIPHLDPAYPVSFQTEFYCDPNWDSGKFPKTCNIGDHVGVRREGEMLEVLGRIVEKFTSGLFKVAIDGIGTHTYPGWQLFRDSTTPCTAQFGSIITQVDNSDLCDIRLKIHSALLCADPRFRDPPPISKDLFCELVSYSGCSLDIL